MHLRPRRPRPIILNVFAEQAQSRDEKRRGTTDTVLAAAADLFQEQGFEATTIRQIAAAAGVSVGRVMSVGDKDFLLLKVFDQRITDEHAALSSSPGIDPSPEEVETNAVVADQVLQIIRPFFQLFAADKQLTRHYAAALVKGKNESAVFNELADELATNIARVLSRYEQDQDDVIRITRVVYNAYIGVLFTWGADKFDTQEAIEEMSETLNWITRNYGG